MLTNLGRAKQFLQRKDDRAEAVALVIGGGTFLELMKGAAAQ